jgi:hypothetical protein
MIHETRKLWIIHHFSVTEKSLKKKTNRNSIMLSKALPRLAKHTKRMTLLQNNTEPIFLLQPEYLTISSKGAIWPEFWIGRS